jgi:hypothetical protein
MSLELLLPFFVDWDEDGKRLLLSSELVFDLTDVKDLDELSLDDGNEMLLDNKDEVLLDDKEEVASCNWSITGGQACPVRSITSLSLQRLLWQIETYFTSK